MHCPSNSSFPGVSNDFKRMIRGEMKIQQLAIVKIYFKYITYVCMAQNPILNCYLHKSIPYSSMWVHESKFLKLKKNPEAKIVYIVTARECIIKGTENTVCGSTKL